MEYTFATKYRYKPIEGVELEKEDMVERDGYRDTETIVQEMISAGERLMDYRRGQYDYEDDDLSTDIDPTRSPSFDLVDAGKIMEEEKTKYEKGMKERIEMEKKKSEDEIIKKYEASKEKEVKKE